MASFSSYSHALRSLPLVWLALTTAPSSVGCAHRAPSMVATRLEAAVAPRVLVLEPELETPMAVETRDLAAALGAGFGRDGALVVIDAALALPTIPDAECTSRLACLRELGREAGCAYVVVTSVVGLGDTAMIRVRFVDVNESGGEQTRQAVVEPADAATLGEALEDVARVLATPFVPAPEPSPPAEPSRARQRWRWLGPMLGVLVAGGATTAVVVGGRDTSEPDVVIVPP